MPPAMMALRPSSLSMPSSAPSAAAPATPRTAQRRRRRSIKTSSIFAYSVQSGRQFGSRRRPRWSSARADSGDSRSLSWWFDSRTYSVGLVGWCRSASVRTRPISFLAFCALATSEYWIQRPTSPLNLDVARSKMLSARRCSEKDEIDGLVSPFSSSGEGSKEADSGQPGVDSVDSQREATSSKGDALRRLSRILRRASRLSSYAA